LKRKDKSLVVVLGMHRSGTSAITRGLEVLGVELGDELMPPAPDNEAGFFEDREINALNVELLRSLGHDWHTLAPITSSEWKSVSIKPLQERAMQVMRVKMRDRKSFGLKDPRLARVLPFWKSVFQKLDLVPRYVIAVRNPLSVAKSLESRNQISAEKSYYLWLQHVVFSILETRGSKRLVVDYDRLLDKPREELERIAKTLHLTAVSADSLEEYRDQYLDKRLRHSRFHPKDLTKVPAALSEVKEAFRLLSEMATDRILPDSANVQRTFKRYQGVLAFAAPAFGWVDKQEGHVTSLEHKISESDSRVTFLEGVLTQRSNDLEAARNSASAYAEDLTAIQGQLETAHATIADLQTELGVKSQQLGERDSGLANLAARLEAVDAEIKSREDESAASHEALTRLSGELEHARAELSNRDSALESARQHTEELAAALREKSRQVDQLTDNIAELTSSLGATLAQLETREHESTESRETLERLNNEIETRSRELTVLDGERRELQAQLESARSRLEEMESQALEAQQAIGQLREEANTLRLAIEQTAEGIYGVASSLESAVERRMLRGGL
jgi:hypothetical protein